MAALLAAVVGNSIRKNDAKEQTEE